MLFSDPIPANLRHKSCQPAESATVMSTAFLCQLCHVSFVKLGEAVCLFRVLFVSFVDHWLTIPTHVAHLLVETEVRFYFCDRLRVMKSLQDWRFEFFTKKIPAT